MVEKLRIHALKSIRDLDVNCSDFTILTGTNSSGKSTIIQALLLFAQNAYGASRLNFNGPLVQLGSFAEVYSNFCSKQNAEISISVFNGGRDITMRITDAVSGGVSVSIDGDLDSEADNLVIFKRFYYLSCNRIGVQQIYENNLSNEDKFGINGQFSYGYFLNHKNDRLSDSLLKSDKGNTLFSQVNYWMKYIVNADVSVEEVPNSGKVKVLYSVGDEQKYRSPVNVGSGVSYLSSVLIMCLASEEKSTLLIENSEIHLHPAAQSKLVDFLYFISRSGRQVVVETHSDHFFNGVRAGMAVGMFDAKSIALNFIYRPEGKSTQCEKITFGKNGRVNNPRKDLFDQFDLDLNRMLGI